AAPGVPWQIGELVYPPQGVPRAMRDLQRPHATQNPSHLSEYVDGADDNGGVHRNSTTVSHAAFLRTEGGRHGVSGVTVNGLGAEAAARIWYRALTRYLTAHATFA